MGSSVWIGVVVGDYHPLAGDCACDSGRNRMTNDDMAMAREALLTNENRTMKGAFEKATTHVMAGQPKRIHFKCSHCGKLTPLLIDGILDEANAHLPG